MLLLKLTYILWVSWIYVNQTTNVDVDLAAMFSQNLEARHQSAPLVMTATVRY